MIEIKVKSNDVGIRLDNFLLKLNIGLTKPLIYKLIRKKNIKINNKKTTFNYHLELDDNISIFYHINNSEKSNFDFMKADKLDDIVYEDKNIIIVNKPVGLLCHDDEHQTTSDTLINRIKKYLVEKGEYDYQNENQFAPTLAHRIDRNTAGLVVASKNHDASVSLAKIFKEHNLSKHYLALLYGIIPDKKNKIHLYIKDDNDKLVSVSKNPKTGYKDAISEYSVQEYIKNKFSLVDIKIITGRKHQIRASFNFLNYPIVGEQKYISKNINKDPKYKHQCLVAYKLQFHIFDKHDVLFYLNNKTFITNKIWFLDFN